MLTYRILTDARQIRRARAVFESVLKGALPLRRTRNIGWPSNHKADASVRFESDTDESLWWCTPDSGDQLVAINFFGIDDPNAASALHIKTQFNFPLDGIRRPQAGVFLEDVNTGQLVLAHRGRMSRGMGAARKSVIFDVMRHRVVRAWDGDRETDVLRIAVLDSPSLIEDLKQFCIEARYASERGRSVDAKDVAETKPRAERRVFSMPDAKLAAYFEEFYGTYRRGATPAGEAACHHGDIVKQLRGRIKDGEVIRKSPHVDLAIRLPRMLVIFEVKTAVNSQSVYTGIGQLVFHGARLGAPGEAVKLCLVLPLSPDERAGELLSKLGIESTRYERSPQGTYQFTGLEAFLNRR